MSKVDIFRKALEKKGAQTGFAPVRGWISTGNMALNYIISNDITKGVPVSRMTFLSGPRGSGKSFILGNVVREAQQKGYHIILIETENSIDKEFMERLGVDTENGFDIIRIFSIEEATEYAKMILDSFGKDDKVFLFIDSLSNMESTQETDKFEKEGVIASGMGLKAKKLKALCSLLNNRIGDRDMGVLCTLHTYLNQDQYGDKYKISGGEGLQYLASIGVMTSSLPLREGSTMVGIRMGATVWKSRYQQVGMKVELEVPYSTGMTKYDGILPILTKLGVIEQAGAWYSVLDSDTGELTKFQRKGIDDVIGIIEKRYGEVIVEIEEKENDDASLETEKLKTETVNKK